MRVHGVSNIEKSEESINGNECDAEDELPEGGGACVGDDVPGRSLEYK